MRADAPLVGRNRYIGQIDVAINRLADGFGGCMVVEGAAGIGKTALVDAAVGLADSHRISVAVARPTELDRIAPLSVLLTALRAGPHPVVEGDALARLAEQDVGRLRLLYRLQERIEEYVLERPLLVVLDDAQWLDELSALAVRALVPALRGAAVLWLVTRRPEGERTRAHEAIDSLVERCGATGLSLAPLSNDDVARFCAQKLGAMPDDTVLVLARGSGGNPFLLDHLLSTLVAEGRVVVEGLTASLTADSDLPAAFLTAVDHRLRAVSPTTRRLLDAASVIARPFTLHEVAGLAGVPAGQMFSAVDEAVKAEVLDDRGDQLAFGHEIVREAVYQRLSQPVRVALHREAADVLQREGHSAVDVAEHVVRSAHRGDRRAVSVLRQAAGDIASRSPGTAADLLLSAVDVLNEQDPLRPEVLADAVRAVAVVGRIADAMRVGDAALRHGLAPSVEASILLGIAEAQKHSGQDAAAVATTTRALDRPGLAGGDIAHLLALRAHALLFASEETVPGHTGGDLAAADAAGAEAARIGSDAGEPAAVVFGTCARTVVALAGGHLDDAVALARDAVRVADLAGGAARHRQPMLWLGRALVASDRFTEADALFEIGQRTAVQDGIAWSLPLWHYYRASLRMAAGRLDDAEAEAEAGLALTERLSARALSITLLSVLAELARRRDDAARAVTQVAAARALTASGFGSMPEDLEWTAARVLVDAGDLAGAWATVRPVVEALPRRMLLIAEDPAAAPGLVRLACAVDARPAAGVVVSVVTELAGRNPGVASLAGAAAHAAGLLADDGTAIRRAVDLYGSAPRPLARASASEDAALAEDRAGRRPQAVKLMNDAAECYRNLGSLRDHSRTIRELRRMGVRRRGGLAAERPPRTGWASLTVAELKVARLVADGLTNRAVATRLFLSPHTVDSHLRHAFTKLGVSSRVELTRQVLENDGRPTPP